jgi:hypothetical protein
MARLITLAAFASFVRAREFTMVARPFVRIAAMRVVASCFVAFMNPVVMHDSCNAHTRTHAADHIHDFGAIDARHVRQHHTSTGERASAHHDAGDVRLPAQPRGLYKGMPRAHNLSQLQPQLCGACVVQLLLLLVVVLPIHNPVDGRLDDHIRGAVVLQPRERLDEGGRLLPDGGREECFVAGRLRPHVRRWACRRRHANYSTMSGRLD